ncbi:hypothetical protein [Catenulispora pinisilvae]|uniref:hypothetical protein n=1 Tax=Catenulispora pinisilvae TaxID=2705253 RepID=UPI001891C695|nr:hypothetical protein [Catenulispora pinisilvae]
MVSRTVPLAVRVEPALGGRWASLRGGGREWLWHRDEPHRAQVVPGDGFVDAGGLEECVPTVRGRPDHGDAWSRPWTAADDSGLVYAVRCPDFELTRGIDTSSGSVVADYRLVAEPGFRFVWAAHALLDINVNVDINADADTHARLRITGNPTTRLFPEAAQHLDRPWPTAARWIEGAWPTPAGLRMDTLGPDDGSAVGAVINAPSVVVEDGPDRLHLAVTADGQPTSIAVWRNLGGFPAEAPYRSIGVEPMLGRVFDLDDAADEDCAVVPAAGEVRWQLTITAHRLQEGTEPHGSFNHTA